MASALQVSVMSEPDRPTLTDISQLDTLDIPELILYLKAEFRSAYFKKAQEILLSREKVMRLDREQCHKKLKQMTQSVDDLKQELSVCKDRCSSLSSLVSTQNKDLEQLRVENAFQKKRYSELLGRVGALEKEVSDLCYSKSRVKSEFGLEQGTQIVEANGAVGQCEGATIDDLDKSLTTIKVEKTLSSATKIESGRLTENVIDISDSESESEENSKENQPNNIVTTLKRKRRLILDSDNEDEDGDGDGKVNLIKPKETNNDFAKLLSGIRSWKDSESKWQHEVDMVYSFDADSRLCMRAVCALYRHHTFEDKGFGQRISFFGKFLLDGGRSGEMKKTVKELEIFDPNGINECRRLSKHYSDVLFAIYQNKEDPFFP